MDSYDLGSSGDQNTQSSTASPVDDIAANNSADSDVNPAFLHHSGHADNGFDEFAPPKDDFTQNFETPEPRVEETTPAPAESDQFLKDDNFEIDTPAPAVSEVADALEDKPAPSVSSVSSLSSLTDLEQKIAAKKEKLDNVLAQIAELREKEQTLVRDAEQLMSE